MWDRLDYLVEAENYLKDSNTYKDVKFGDDDLVKLVEQSNKMFKQLLSKQNISSSQFKYFSYNYKKLSNFGNMHLLPKIHKRLKHVPGRQSFVTVVHLRKKFLNFWIIILNLLCNLLNCT